MLSRPAPFDSECSDRVWETLFKSNSAALAVVDPNGQFRCVNDAFSFLVGRGSAELVRSSWQSITHPSDIAPDADMVRACVDGDTQGYSLEKRYLTPSGDTVHVRIWVRSVRMWGKLACFLVHAIRLDGASEVTTPAPVVMRPKMDILDLVRDNPWRTVTVLGAVITACAKFLSDKHDLERQVESLLKAEEHRASEAQKRTDLEAIRREMGGNLGDREKGSPH